MISNLILVEVPDAPVNPARTWHDKATNMTKPLPATQTCYLFNGGQYPLGSFNLDVDDRAGPLRPGRYLLGGASVRLYKGELQLDKYRMQLVSVEDALAQLRPVPQPVAKAG